MIADLPFSNDALLSSTEIASRLLEGSAVRHPQSDLVLFAMARSVDGMDGHCERVSAFAGWLGEQMDLPEEQDSGTAQGWVCARYWQDRNSSGPSYKDWSLNGTGMGSGASALDHWRKGCVSRSRVFEMFFLSFGIIMNDWMVQAILMASAENRFR
jgi:hypothetical protein